MPMSTAGMEPPYTPHSTTPLQQQHGTPGSRRKENGTEDGNTHGCTEPGKCTEDNADYNTNDSNNRFSSVKAP